MGLVTKVGEGSSNTLYLTIKAGNIVQTVDENHEGAVERVWEKDDKKGIAYEVPYKNLTGYITSLELKQGKFGEDLRIGVLNGGDKAVLTVKVDSRFFADFAKKAPNIDFTKEVVLDVFDFVPKGKDKPSVGFTIKQGGEKIGNAYYDYEKKKSPKGYPVMEEEKPDSDDWKLFFLQERKYLKKKLALLELPTDLRHIDSEPVVEEEATKKEPLFDDDLPL